MLENLSADLRRYGRFCSKGCPLPRVLLRILYGDPAALAVILTTLMPLPGQMQLPLLRQLLQLAEGLTYHPGAPQKSRHLGAILRMGCPACPSRESHPVLRKW